MKNSDKINLTEELTDLIEDGYGGSAEFTKILDLGIEMLFYVEEEAFTQREIQQVVTALRGIIGVLRG
ncbi:hypothetical protein M3P19_13360 [Muricauda sp. 2012CJ35-5]|uniref:Acyl carrier protein n=1 Tax=Flagellimonas spongiicola TaxID=2942208 RepID=A0ABT0PWA1_9FLAO|nr:hypothetical protein [Allomuricauda spongiicola]MCL6275002.1 hypothetical protein [Allomuricauda spongiicola]